MTKGSALCSELCALRTIPPEQHTNPEISRGDLIGLFTSRHPSISVTEIGRYAMFKRAYKDPNDSVALEVSNTIVDMKSFDIVPWVTHARFNSMTEEEKDSMVKKYFHDEPDSLRYLMRGLERFMEEKT